jgi:hypothetical protein
MRYGVMVAALLLPVAAQAQQASKFDLVCDGTSSSYKSGVRTYPAFHQVLHIDLDRSQYCVGDCQKIEDIARADPLMITLADERRRPSALATYGNVRKIDRTTGKYTITYANSGELEIFSAEASCVKAAFTPFPLTKF